MSFCSHFNEYLSLLEITYPQFARYSGLSVSAVRRYKNGESEPAPDSEQFNKLTNAFFRLAREKGFELSEEEIREKLQGSLKNSLNISYETYVTNLNTLINALDIRVSVLAKALSFDSSYISKILAGQRKPRRVSDFTQSIGSYISRVCIDEQQLTALSQLLNCDAEQLDSPRAISGAVTNWLGNNTVVAEKDPIENFLDKLEDFNLDEYINVIHFNDIKLPTAPFRLPTSKTYTTIEGMKKCELDFIKATVLSKSKKDVILYSDMPLEEMAKDEDFAKKWMFGMAMLLKKGLHLHFIHNVYRPFQEMMLGLEGNIPMYMTGQISPYYLPAPTNAVFTHIIKVSGAAALEGCAIAGHQTKGEYVLTKSDERIRFIREKAEDLLKKAKPLMDIYRSDRKVEYRAAMKQSWKTGDRLTVSSALPIFTLPKEALREILTRNKLDGSEVREIEEFRADYLAMVCEFLKNNKLAVVLPEPSKEQFEAAPIHLALSEMFCETDVPYTYEEYTAHLQATKYFAVQHPNLTVKTDSSPAFRNITYSVIHADTVIVSKNKSPAIHFVIHHKKMVQAFMNFIPPIKE
nr:hypothetical protein [Ruminococcus sp.]